MALDIKISLDSIMKLSLAKRIAVLVLINAVIIGAGYWFLIGPKYDEIGKMRSKLSSLNVTLNENRVIAADIPRFIKEKEEMEARLAAAVAQLPNEKEIPDLIDSISSAGEDSGLKILLFRPGRENPKGFYAEVPVTMSVRGTFESLFDFSVRVANLPRIVNLGGMDVSSMGHRGRTPMLSANFTVTTFRFIPQEGK
ncbi:MAG: type 4a pilus biogenesis protein PilO [Thermodesulfobacteriota bacterium]